MIADWDEFTAFHPAARFDAVAGLMLTAEAGGVLLFDPLWSIGIRVRS